MPSIHYLNPPPHPFFDFVANLEDHPFFAAYGPQNLPFRRNGNPNQQAPSQQEQEPAEKSKKATEKQPTVEDDTQDPPEVDPAALNAEQTPEECRGMPFRRGGRCGRGRGRDPAGPSGFGPHHGPHPHGPPGFGPHHGPHPHGPPNQLGQISYDVPYSRNFHQRLNEMVVTGTHSVDYLPIIHWISPNLSGLLAWSSTLIWRQISLPWNCALH